MSKTRKSNLELKAFLQAMLFFNLAVVLPTFSMNSASGVAYCTQLSY